MTFKQICEQSEEGNLMAIPEKKSFFDLEKNKKCKLPEAEISFNYLSSTEWLKQSEKQAILLLNVTQNSVA